MIDNIAELLKVTENLYHTAQYMYINILYIQEDFLGTPFTIYSTHILYTHTHL